jgi:hypothetical protein
LNQRENLSISKSGQLVCEFDQVFRFLQISQG